jgi:hypothetical protein
VQEKFTTAREASPTPVRAPARRHWRLRLVGLCALVAAIVGATAGIQARGRDEAAVKQWTDAQAIPEVAVITPKAGPAIETLTLPGTVEAWYEAPIYARVSGYLKNWYFDYGAHVKKGNVLAEIDAPDLDAQLAAAQAKLKSGLAVVNIRKAELQFAESTYICRNIPAGPSRRRSPPRRILSICRLARCSWNFTPTIWIACFSPAPMGRSSSDCPAIRTWCESRRARCCSESTDCRSPRSVRGTRSSLSR